VETACHFCAGHLTAFVLVLFTYLLAFLPTFGAAFCTCSHALLVPSATAVHGRCAWAAFLLVTSGEIQPSFFLALGHMAVRF